MTNITDENTMAFAEPDGHNIIDIQNPVTGLSFYAGEDLETLRKRYPKAELIKLSDFCAAKAARQDAPVEWSEVTEENYNDALGCLPPIIRTNGAFLVGEPSDHHAQSGMPRYSCLCRCAGPNGEPQYFSSSRPMSLAEFNAKFNRPKQLTCCCCGDSTKGRQWWNRDTGYGICLKCVDEQTNENNAEEIRSYYGVRGVHYAIE